MACVPIASRMPTRRSVLERAKAAVVSARWWAAVTALDGAAQMAARDEQIDRIAARLKEWSAEVDGLEERAKSAAADVKAEIETRVAELKGQRDLLSAELQRLRSASESAWNDLFEGAQAMTNALEQAFERARARFRD